MKPVRKTHVVFFYPDLFVSETSTRVVKSREVSKVKVPKGAYAFKFFDTYSLIARVDGKKVLLTSERLNPSPIHYYGGKLYTPTEVKREFPNEYLFHDNIKDHGWRRMIRCRFGNWEPFLKKDVLVKAHD